MIGSNGPVRPAPVLPVLARAAVALALIAAAALAAWVRLAPVRLPPEVAPAYRTALGEPLFYTPDAWYHLRMARELAATGRRGEPREDGPAWDPKSFAPAGRRVRASLLQALEVAAWRAWPGGESLATVAFYLPVAFAPLLVLAAFWIGRRLAGAAGGLAAAALAALHPEIVSHTHAGMADTTAPALALFALAAGAGLGLATAAWRALAERSPWRPVAIWGGLLAVVLALFAATWTGWPAGALVAGAPAGAAVLAALWTRAGTPRRRLLLAAGALALAAAAAALLLVSPAGRRLGGYAAGGALGPFPSGAREVQELAAVAPVAVLERLGGGLAVGLAAVGVLWLAVRAPRPAGPLGAVLLVAWAVPAAAAGSRAMRFLVYAAPAVAVAAGCAAAGLAAALIGRSARFGPALRGAVAVVLVVAAAWPWRARLEGFADRRPAADRALAEAAAAIGERTPADALVYAWWDHGHMLAALADRAVAIDGATFQTRRLYWLSAALAARDEALAVNVLRLIGCGGDDTLYRALIQDGVAPVRVVPAMRQALRQTDPEHAIAFLENAGAGEEALAEARRLLSCRPPPSWLVVTSGLTAKTASWAWYGVWSFDRPNRPPGARMTAPTTCTLSPGGALACADGFAADLAGGGWENRSSPGHLAAAGLPDPDGLAPVLHQHGNGLLLTRMRPWLVESLYSRLYFFAGRGLERFRLERVYHSPPHTQRVLVYRVEWDAAGGPSPPAN